MVRSIRGMDEKRVRFSPGAQIISRVGTAKAGDEGCNPSPLEDAGFDSQAAHKRCLTLAKSERRAVVTPLCALLSGKI